jgi:hypothetical protein
MRTLVCFLLGIFVLSSGQSSFAETFDFSVLGALTYTNYHFDESYGISTSGKVAFGGGVTVGYEIDPFLVLEAGPLYLTHSTTLEQNNQSAEQTLRFIDFPVLVRFVPISQIAIYAGPYFGIQVNANSSDFGFMGGLGYRLPIATTTKLRLDGLYQFGLADLNSNYSTQNTRSFVFLAGVMFETW